MLLTALCAAHMYRLNCDMCWIPCSTVNAQQYLTLSYCLGKDGMHDKINQDRGCVVYPYRSSEDEALFMVLDGHGVQGDRISDFVMRKVNNFWYSASIFLKLKYELFRLVLRIYKRNISSLSTLINTFLF